MQKLIPTSKSTPSCVRSRQANVASYGQIAALVDRCTARMVGYAMHAIGPEDADVPWQRVINSQGRVSSHGDGIGTSLQRQMLEDEGVVFDPNRPH